MTKQQTWRLSERQKSEIIARLATGKYSHTQLAQEYGVTKSAISRLRKRREMTHLSTQQQISSKTASIQVRLLEKGYSLLELKLDSALTSKRDFNQLKLAELSRVIYDLWKQQQVEALKPTDIRLEYKVDIQKLKEQIEILEKGKPEELLQSLNES